MMATAEPPSNSSLLPLLESLEDDAAGQSEQTDAYLTIANRLSGEEGPQFLPAVEKHFSRLGKTILVHVTSPTAELSQAALQALGFCLYHSRVVSGVPETFATDILSALCSLVVKSTDKNTCTRALWVISKQSFPPDVVGKKVSSILGSLESVWSRDDIQSVVMEHEALNVIIRMLEQVPAEMGIGALRWAKLVIPLVVHSASKVRLRAAAAMEMGMPLLLEKQMDVAGIIEPMMSTKLIPELQKLFMSKNEANVLKLWPLFVKLLGKLLHKGGPFINSLLHLEELGFRSSSPTIKKIAFIAWKSLIDNFALNPDILCSAKRMKLLMQPLASINVRTEVLLLTKVEVWWYLVVQLGPNLSPNFDQVSVPLLQCTIGSDSSSVPGTPSRAVSQNGAPSTPKTSFNSSANMPRMSLNSSIQVPTTFPSIRLLGLEMLLHYFLGPEVVATAAKKKLILSLEPLNHPLLSGASSFTKHAAVLTSNIRDGLTNIGKDAPDSLLAVLWTSLIRFVKLTIESVGSKKDRQGSEVLTLTLQALQSIITSEALPADKVLILFEATVKGIPQRVLGSASYQVGKMDVLNGTPALFLILLLYNSSMLSAYIEDERFYQCLQTLVGCGLSGPTSPLTFAESVLGAIIHSAGSVQNKEQLWRMWSVVVNPLTDTITKSNEVNQGDALEHNFSAMHSALLFPITHLLHGTPLQQVAQKSLLTSWSKLYTVFARCSALVVTAEENICCEELCAKMAAAIDRDALKVPSTLNAVSSILQVMVECVDFSPYTPQFQQKMKSPLTPVNWMRKRNKVLGNLSTFQSLLLQCLEVYLEDTDASPEATGLSLVSILSALFTNLALANTVKEALTSLIQPLTLFYKQSASELPKFSSQLLAKLEKLFCDVLGCLQTRSALAYDDELLALLSPLLCVSFPHKNKQLRTSSTQFWNSTFGNSTSLTYPDEIRPILSQVKQKTPILLPSFEVVCVPDELSGPYSSESSQLETKLSGMPVSSVGKRDSLLGKAVELKDRSSTKTSKPVSTKLDFGSPKPPPRGVLEEEASIDFVFIPPETKERVLTEHQKEVKRTKRVDIPAMYNNLDASLDTTVFSQFTQSQDDSLDKLSTKQADNVTIETSGRVFQEDIEKEEDLAKTTHKSQEAVENMPEIPQQEEAVPESADVSMEDNTKSEDGAEDLDQQPKEDTSPNVSASSDLVSGTPQKPNSRRQSFITLEKYAEGKPASPSNASNFTGPLIKTSNSQESTKTNSKSSSQTSRTSTGPNSQDSQSSQTGNVNSQCSVHSTLDSPVRPKDSSTRTKPVRLTERLPNPTEDEDMIPDTQTEVEGTKTASSPEDTTLSSQEEDSEHTLDDSQSSMSQNSLSEPRKSRRHRVRPLLPGDSPVKQDKKSESLKRRRSEEETQSDSQQTDNRRTTRSQQAAEDDKGRRKLRGRPQTESSQTNSQGKTPKRIRLFNVSENLLSKPESKRRSASQQESSQSDNGSQSQGKQRRRSAASLEAKEDSGTKKKVTDKEESSQTTTHAEETANDKTEKASQTITSSPQTCGISPEFNVVEQTVKDDKLKIDSQIITPQTESQEPELIGTVAEEKVDSQLVAACQTDQSQVKTNTLVSESEVKDEPMTSAVTDDNLSQEDSQVTPSSSDSQSLRRSRRSKTAESEEESSNSQAETNVRGRRSKGKVQEEQSVDTPGSAKSSKGRGKYTRRKSSPVVSSMDSSESESSEVKQMPSKKGRKPRLSLPSPLSIDQNEGNNSIAKDHSDPSQKADSQSIEATDVTSLEDSQFSQDSQASESLQVTSNTEEQSDKESPMDVEVDAAEEKTEPDDTRKSDSLSVSPRDEQTPKDSSVEDTSSQEGIKDSSSAKKLESVEHSAEQTKNSSPCEANVEDTPAPQDETMQSLYVSQSSEEKAEEDSGVKVAQTHQDDSNHQEEPVDDAVEDGENTSSGQNLMEEEPAATNQEEEPTDQHPEAVDDITPLQESNEDNKTIDVEDNNTVANLDTPLADDDGVFPEPTSKDVFPDSPAKQKDLEALMAADVGESPRTRGTWSPSASPSTSILKKGLKRPLEEETTSPLLKSRRVTFADPIQHQELADDIDRRSPAVRTSSPRRTKGSSIPQPKFVTTPTKGLLVLSPRNLHSPGYKSSKKCLISEMSKEPQPVSRDCIYPALVGCSTPVEAVLPQISSNMWSRGFGQLVRARNIKTVGDLSALTPSEIKTLPIRSPKISNVKKALKIYEQQRKGRGGDELKSFDEMEMLTSELEETGTPQNQDEDDKTSGETLATALVDEPVPVEGIQTPDTLTVDEGPGGRPHPEGLLPSEVEALTLRVTPLELSYCSPQQLVQMHDDLGGMMRRVVVELQTRLCQTDKP